MNYTLFLMLIELLKNVDLFFDIFYIYKLESMGVYSDLLKLIKDFLNSRFQRVLRNGQTSDQLPVKSGVPQGSILRSLFFLIKLMTYLTVQFLLQSSLQMTLHYSQLFIIIMLGGIPLMVIEIKQQNRHFKWKIRFNPDLK